MSFTKQKPSEWRVVCNFLFLLLSKDILLEEVLILPVSEDTLFEGTLAAVSARFSDFVGNESVSEEDLSHAGDF